MSGAGVSVSNGTAAGGAINRPERPTQWELGAFKPAANTGLATAQVPVRTFSGHGGQPWFPFPNSWAGQQCAMGVAIDAAAIARIGPCRPTTKTISSAMKRQRMSPVYTL